jgi:hypothetical protein
MPKKKSVSQAEAKKRAAASAEDKIASVIGDGPKDLLYLKEGFQRHTSIRSREHLFKLKCLAYWLHIPSYQAEFLIFEDYFKRNPVKEIPESDVELPDIFKKRQR